MSCWHLRHGATIDTVPDAHAAAVNAASAAFGHAGDGGVAIAWLLRRGLPMNDKLKKTVQEILQQDSCWETREDLQREGLLRVK